GHGAGGAGGKTHIVDNRYPFSAGLSRFHVGRDWFKPSLVGGKHAARGEVLNLAVHQQPQRSSLIRLTQVEFKTVRLGKATELQHFEAAKVVVRQEVRQNVVPMVFPRSRWRMRITTIDNFERRIRWVAGEVFVRKHIDVMWMVNC